MLSLVDCDELENAASARGVVDPPSLLRPRRKITGYSAVLLPFTAEVQIDWRAFEGHVHRTAEAGLIPAVNMDTGYGPLLDDSSRHQVLERTRRLLGRRPFAAGATVFDQPGDLFDLDRYCRAVEPIVDYGAVPVIFQSYGLTSRRGQSLGEAYAQIGERCGQFIAFELGAMFAPFGAIYDLESYAAMMRVPQCIGAKHSSLRREPEWQRLILRDRLRPDFKVLTGNDLAVDMVMYGSDYLLGLSTFAPDHFAHRDALWESGDPRFYELNDALQALGHFAFREPVPAYKHSAAQFLKLRGWIADDATPQSCPRRPEGDLAVLHLIAQRLERL